MGGRGTFAKGNNVDFTYKTIEKIKYAKILQGIGKNHSLPVESHGSKAYIKLKKDGTSHEMRIYNKNKELIKEIAYHVEPKLSRNGLPVLHIHIYKKAGDFTKREPRLLTQKEIIRYKPFLRGIKL